MIDEPYKVLTAYRFFPGTLGAKLLQYQHCTLLVTRARMHALVENQKNKKKITHGANFVTPPPAGTITSCCAVLYRYAMLLLYYNMQ